jgi:predicted SAM-dependent methyltransferase
MQQIACSINPLLDTKRQEKMAVMLNIGCGTTYHPDWINIDYISQSSDVISCDLTKGLPFHSNTIAVCYSSHVLEHLRKEEAYFFIKEQKRILKTRGIIRIVVPDLEVICKNYLKYLEEALSGKKECEFRYDYSLLELFDQTTRDRVGGELAKVWASQEVSESDMEFIIARHGKEAENAMYRLRNRAKFEIGASKRIKQIFTKQALRRAVNKARYIAVELVVLTLLGKQYVKSFREGVFRNSGEIHRIMYDRFSLERLLSSCGFVDIKVCKADESRIPDFNRFQLDAIDGAPRKPDSLFMEAITV